MNKIILSVLAIGLSVGATSMFVACSEDEPMRLNSSFAKSGYTPENPENIYDSAGIMHNELMNLCRESMIGFITNGHYDNIYLEDAVNISNGILHSYNYDTNGCYDMVSQVIEDTSHYCVRFIDNLDINDVCKNIMIDLIDKIVGMSNDSIYDYVEYKNAIIDFENSIMSNQSLDDIDRVILLSSTSVMRYSLYYWNNVSEYLSYSKKAPKWLRNTIMAVADVAGAVGGAAAGVVTGATAGSIVAPGVGTTAGAIAGGTVGAITGAVAASNGAGTLVNNFGGNGSGSGSGSSGNGGNK